MASLRVEQQHISESNRYFSERDLSHLRVIKRGALLTIVSGPEHDKVPHARLRRVSPQRWALEMPTHTGRWQPTGLTGTLQDSLRMLTDNFGWTLEPIY